MTPLVVGQWLYLKGVNLISFKCKCNFFNLLGNFALDSVLIEVQGMSDSEIHDLFIS